MPPKPRQSNEEFVAACECGGSPETARLAVMLREEFAKYGRVTIEDVRSDMTVMDSGVFHPSDSIDLLEYTLMLEHLTGTKFEPEEVMLHFGPEREELTVGEWVRRVVSLTAAKGGINHHARGVALSAHLEAQAECPPVSRS